MASYCQSLVFDCPYLLCNGHFDWWLFQEIFFFLLILFLFPRNSFERSWTCFHGIETHLQNTTNKSVFFLSVHFFTCSFLIILCLINLRFQPFHTFSLHVNTQDESVLFLLVVSQSLYVIMLSAEIRMTKLSKIWYQNK